jgi:hypothetical protein
LPIVIVTRILWCGIFRAPPARRELPDRQVRKALPVLPARKVPRERKVRRAQPVFKVLQVRWVPQVQPERRGPLDPQAPWVRPAHKVLPDQLAQPALLVLLAQPAPPGLKVLPALLERPASSARTVSISFRAAEAVQSARSAQSS